MSIVYYLDADLLGTAKILLKLRSDVTYPDDEGGEGIDRKCRPKCPVRVDTKDSDWLPLVSENNWIVITKDVHLMSKLDEVEAIKKNLSRVVIIRAIRPYDRKFD